MKIVFFLQLFLIILLVLIDNQVHENFLVDIYHTKDSSEKTTLHISFDCDRNKTDLFEYKKYNEKKILVCFFFYYLTTIKF
jgi:hypothetical protein